MFLLFSLDKQFAIFNYNITRLSTSHNIKTDISPLTND